MNKFFKLLLSAVLSLFFVGSVFGATLTCEQVTDASLEVSQFSNTQIEIVCSATGGSVSNIQITPNADPSSGLDIVSSQVISSSLGDQESESAKWTVAGNSPNNYEISYVVSSDATSAWEGASTTQVDVLAPAKLTVEYISAPSTYTAGDTLDLKISNIGGTTASNIKLKLNSGSLVSYPSTIQAGASASYSWTSTSGFDEAATYVTKAYIGDILQDSVSTVVSEASQEEDEEVVEEDNDDSPSSSSSGGGGGGGYVPPTVVDTQDNEDNTDDVNKSSVVSININENTPLEKVINMKKGEAAKITIRDSSFSRLAINTKFSAKAMKFKFKKGTVEQNGNEFVVDGNKKFKINKEGVKAYETIVVEHPASLNTIMNSDSSFDFKVKKSWVDENDFDKENIVLVRYGEDESVTEIKPELITEDDTFFYFSAKISKLSVYMIAASTGREIVEKDTNLVLDDDISGTANTDSSEVQETDAVAFDDSSFFGSLWFYLILITIVCVAGFVFVKFRNK